MTAKWICSRCKAATVDAWCIDTKTVCEACFESLKFAPAPPAKNGEVLLTVDDPDGPLDEDEVFEPYTATQLLKDRAADKFKNAEHFKGESDPNGIDQHALGAKLDAGKLKAALVMGDFARALTEVIRVGTFGANKYTDHGWLHVDDGFNRYTDAMQRHYLKEITEGPLDQDSGITHAGHLAWNALARLELMLREKS